MYLFNNSKWSLVSLVFPIVPNPGYRPSFETLKLNTPGINAVGTIWRGYLSLVNRQRKSQTRLVIPIKGVTRYGEIARYIR